MLGNELYRGRVIVHSTTGQHGNDLGSPAAHGHARDAAPAAPIYVRNRFEEWILRLWQRPRWLAPLAIFGCVAAACTYVLTNNPTDDRPDLLGPCAFKTLTGYDCPGCGGTRMVWYVLHGNLLQAARHHLVAFVAIPVVIYAYVVLVADRIFRVKLPTTRIPWGVCIGYVLVWLMFAVARDLPWQPFHTFFV